MAKKKTAKPEIDFETDIGTEAQNDKYMLQLPVNFIQLGEIERDDIKVYIKQDVYAAIEKLADSDTSKETGSFLVGDYMEDLGVHVVISGYIEAKYTDASASTLTFTHETWDYVHKEQESLYPGKKIIGWQHSHPGYGVFLSNYDLFIHENFFNLPFQTAYVVDPVQNIRGFFQWKDGKVEKLKGYYVYGEVGEPVKIEAPAKRNSTEGTSGNEISSIRKKIRTAVICALSLFVILSGCIVYLILGNTNLSSALSAAEARQAAQIDQIVGYYNSLPDDETISQLQDQIDEQQVKIVEQAATIEELQTNLSEPQAEESTDDYVYFMEYTVQKGDSLTKICNQYGIDYAANRKIILGVNGIKNANLIGVGQTILIPVSMVGNNE